MLTWQDTLPTSDGNRSFWHYRFSLAGLRAGWMTTAGMVKGNIIKSLELSIMQWITVNIRRVLYLWSQKARLLILARYVPLHASDRVSSWWANSWLQDRLKPLMPSFIAALCPRFWYLSSSRELTRRPLIIVFSQVLLSVYTISLAADSIVAWVKNWALLVSSCKNLLSRT